MGPNGRRGLGLGKSQVSAARQPWFSPSFAKLLPSMSLSFLTCNMEITGLPLRVMVRNHRANVVICKAHHKEYWGQYSY